jgi:hypothetical protein
VESSEASRQQAILIHTVLFASLGAYAVLAFTLRRGGAESAGTHSPPHLFPILALVGAAQFAVASWFARAALRARGRVDGSRLRRYFLIRGASAEAIGLYALLVSTTGGPLLEAVALFVMAAAAMLVCAPTRSAWDDAVSRAESPGP